jgi:hypothetical protein
MLVSPVKAYTRLLKDCEPSQAAEVVAKYSTWHWSPVEYNSDAPLLLREMADQDAWERFSAPNPTTRKQVAAEYLFRAASLQTGAARVLLVESAQSLISEILNTWLQGRPG